MRKKCAIGTGAARSISSRARGMRFSQVPRPEAAAYSRNSSYIRNPDIYREEGVAGSTASSAPMRQASRSIDRQRRRIDPRVLTNYPGGCALFIE